MADEKRRLDVSTAELNEAVMKVAELSKLFDQLQSEIQTLKERVDALENR